jgi:hypothetical protein
MGVFKPWFSVYRCRSLVVADVRVRSQRPLMPANPSDSVQPRVVAACRNGYVVPKSPKRLTKSHRTRRSAVPETCSLADLEKDDNDEIFRFRMSNLERLYGFIRAADFEVIWFDPTHQTYPTDP